MPAPRFNPQSSVPVYVVCSDDPLLKLERSRELIAQGRQMLPDAEFLLYTFSDLQGLGGANLKSIENEMSDPGLFGGDRIIKVNLKDLDTTAIDLCKLVAASFRPGLFIILELPRLNTIYTKVDPIDPTPLKHILSFAPGLDESSSTKKSAPKKGSKRTPGIETRKKEALGYLKGLGANIEVLYPPEGNELKSWIAQRGRTYHLSIAPQVVEFIAQSCDNNLLLIDQSLRLMELLHAERKQNPNALSELTLDEVETYFTQDARYTGFELPQALFSGDSLKALNIINSLCSGQEMNLTTALNLLIGRLDESLTCVALGKANNIARADFRTKSAFFMARNIKVRASQEAHLKAIQEMPQGMFEFLNQCLSEASIALSQFNPEGALRALQRMALAVKTSAVVYLSPELS